MNYLKNNRYLILGNGGSGKSYLASKLSELTKIKAYHLDEFYWQKDGNRIEQANWNTIHKKLIDKKHWIIEGTQMRLLVERIKRSDQVIFLDTNLLLCLFRVWRKFSIKQCDYGFPSTKSKFKTLLWLCKFELLYKKTIKQSIARDGKTCCVLKNKQAIESYLSPFA